MLEAKAKDTGASVLQKKRSSKNFFRWKKSSNIFSGEKGRKIFFGRSPIEENKKRSSQIFCEISGAFQQNFNRSKKNSVLEPRTGKFWRTLGFEAKAKDLIFEAKAKTSKCILEEFLEAKDVVEDSTSDMHPMQARSQDLEKGGAILKE